MGFILDRIQSKLDLSKETKEEQISAAQWRELWVSLRCVRTGGAGQCELGPSGHSICSLSSTETHSELRVNMFKILLKSSRMRCPKRVLLPQIAVLSGDCLERRPSGRRSIVGCAEQKGTGLGYGTTDVKLREGSHRETKFQTQVFH